MRQPRSVTYLYGGVALALLLVIATVALVLTPPQPPSVAEFAPRAEDRIEDTPDVQTSRFGSGGEVGVGRLEPTPAPATSSSIKKDVLKARVRRCFGDPPRQTEDPQSPPCVSHWEGDNGGATYKGVTRDEIRLAVHFGFRGDRTWTRLLDHFNRRYEFYGRTLRIVPIETDEQQAAAVAADEEAHAFAGIPPLTWYEHARFQGELARRRLISVTADVTYTRETDLQRWAPYAWSYHPDLDEIERQAAAFICASLAGRPAAFAGGSERLRPRRFAIFVPKEADGPMDVSVLRSDLARCGVDAGDTYDIFSTDVANNPQLVATTYARLQTDGVTSIILLISSSDASNYMAAAPPEYQPEWILGGTTAQDGERQWRVGTPAQTGHLFGALTVNKLLVKEDMPAYYAQQDSPDWTGAQSLATQGEEYRSLLVLASGIQLAGPHLTPETFAAGLQEARFPNPGAGSVPFYQAAVGFGPGDFTFTRDSAVVSWSNAASSYGFGGEDPGGGFCYVGRGARFAPGRWRDASDRLFDPDPRNCR